MMTTRLSDSYKPAFAQSQQIERTYTRLIYVYLSMFRCVYVSLKLSMNALSRMANIILRATSSYLYIIVIVTNIHPMYP